MRIAAPIAAVLVAAVAGVRPGVASAQCSVGWPLYHDCLGVTWQGCCTLKNTSAGQTTTLQWCENGFLCTAICDITGLTTADYQPNVCGWNVDPSSGQGLYDCVSVADRLNAQGYVDPAKVVDPGGTHPYTCQIPCGSVPVGGCCEGKTLLKYCKNGSLTIIDCTQNGSSYNFCGWDPVMGDYECSSLPAEGPSGHPYACGGTTCVPGCAGKTCGTDGCGGTCGTCGTGQACTASGTCQATVCQPACGGKECGPDGCGSSCGTCAAGNACGTGGTCHPAGCDPQCVDKDCGPDGCGGSCGTCPGLSVCNDAQKCSFQCTPDCNNKDCGDDLCGGVCGTCAPPKTCVWFKCVNAGEDPGAPPDPDPDAAWMPDIIIYLSDPPPVDNGVGCPEGSVTHYGGCVPITDPPVTTGKSGACDAGASGSAGAALALVALAGWAIRRRPRPTGILGERA